jgi:hypothetical protein
MATAIPARDQLDEVQEDLASLASRAAVELDHIVLGRVDRAGDLSAVTRLATSLRDWSDVNQPAAPDSALNPTTAVVLHRALNEYTGHKAPTQLQEILDKAAEVTERLTTVAKQPASLDGMEVIRLRTFCIDLSKQALAALRSPYDDPQNAFHRLR